MLLPVASITSLSNHIALSPLHADHVTWDLETGVVALGDVVADSSAPGTSQSDADLQYTLLQPPRPGAKSPSPLDVQYLDTLTRLQYYGVLVALLPYLPAVSALTNCGDP